MFMRLMFATFRRRCGSPPSLTESNVIYMVHRVTILNSTNPYPYSLQLVERLSIMGANVENDCEGTRRVHNRVKRPHPRWDQFVSK